MIPRIVLTKSQAWALYCDAMDVVQARGTLERPVWYEADFVYQENGKTIVEDFKSSSTRTDSYVIKRKLMLSVHGISIIEVTK